MADGIERYAAPRPLPVVPVLPSPALGNPDDGQTGASAGRLAPLMAEAAAQAAGPAVADIAADAFAPPAVASGYDIGTLDMLAASHLGASDFAASAVSADPSVETFAEDYLNRRQEVRSETGRFDNVGALFSPRGGRNDPGLL